MIKDDYKYYLSGLKGLACIFIMLGHFFGLYKYAQFFSNIRFLDLIINSPFSFVIDEGYWLSLFFVISGYLVAKSKICNFRDCILKIVNRFFRLGIPILFSYLVIFAIYKAIGFHTVETKDLFICNWFQKYYSGQYSLKDVILSPFDVLIRGISKLNSPYWVLRAMLFSSVIIYLLKLYYQFMKERKHEALLFSSLIVLTFGSVFVSTILTACLIGMLISFYEDKGIEKTSYFSFWALVVLMAIYVIPPKLVSPIFFGALIIYIPRIKWLNRIFLSKLLQFFGKISWGIYSFHWPIISSIGAIAILKLSGTIGLTGAYLSSFIIIFAATVFAAFVFCFTFEKLSYLLTAKINMALGSLLNNSNK